MSKIGLKSAFPTDRLHTVHCPKCKQGYIQVIQEGMTFHQYLAGQALVGLLSADWCRSDRGVIYDHKTISELAVRSANALIRELEK